MGSGGSGGSGQRHEMAPWRTVRSSTARRTGGRAGQVTVAAVI